MSCYKSDTIWCYFKFTWEFFLNLKILGKILVKYPVKSQKFAKKLDVCDDVIIGPNTPPPHRHQSSSFGNPLPPSRWWRHMWTTPKASRTGIGSSIIDLMLQEKKDKWLNIHLFRYLNCTALYQMSYWSKVKLRIPGPMLMLTVVFCSRFVYS